MDTKFLLKKGRTWYLNFTFPKRMRMPELSGRRVRISLQTPDLKVAQRWRDRHVRELLQADNELHVLEILARKITEADERLRDKLDELLPDYALRGLERQDGISLGELRARYLTYLEERRKLKASSIEKYRSALDCFEFVVGSDSPASELSHQQLQEFAATALRFPKAWSYRRQAGLGVEDIIAECENSGKPVTLLARNSVRYILVVAKSMYKWAIEDEQLPRSFRMPFKSFDIYVQAEEQKHKLPPTHEEADMLCAMPFPNTGKIGKTEWKYLPLIARYTGMRMSEIAQLHQEDFVKESGVLCIKICRDVKTESSRRMVPVADKLLPCIEQLLKDCPGSGRVFSKCGDLPYGKSVKYAHAFLKLWNIAAKRIASGVSFHCWRVYANAEMSRAGVDVIDRERILGHANDRTNAVYLPDDYQRLKKGVNKIY